MKLKVSRRPQLQTSISFDIKSSQKQEGHGHEARDKGQGLMLCFCRSRDNLDFVISAWPVGEAWTFPYLPFQPHKLEIGDQSRDMTETQLLRYYTLKCQRP
jgi:hypothetical protein